LYTTQHTVRIEKFNKSPLNREFLDGCAAECLARRAATF
jgi:hypothetical protein